MVSKKGTKEPKKEIRELNNSTKDDKKSSLKKGTTKQQTG
jgi:hypothetical protein